MNITMLFSTPMPPREGIGFYCTNLARELVRQGHEVTLITRGKRRTQESAHPDGYRLIEGAFFPVYPFHVHLHGLLLRQTIRKLEPKTDVFHLHSPLVPVIETRKPVITTVHSPMKYDNLNNDIHNAQTLLSRMQLPISAYLELKLFERAEMITTVADWVAGYLRQHYGLAQQKIRAIGNGFDDGLFKPKPHDRSTDAPYVLFVGRLAPGKGLFDLLKAFSLILKSCPRTQLKIVGEGPLRLQLENETKRAGCATQVQFLGALTGTRRADLALLYQNASVYTLPSYHEGLPTTLIEAMACATPVVTTDTTGCSELVDGVSTGLRVPVGDYQRLAELITELLKCPQKASSLGQAARRFVEERFTWAKLSEQYLEVYQAAQS